MFHLFMFHLFVYVPFVCLCSICLFMLHLFVYVPFICLFTVTSSSPIGQNNTVHHIVCVFSKSVVPDWPKQYR